MKKTICTFLLLTALNITSFAESAATAAVTEPSLAEKLKNAASYGVNVIVILVGIVMLALLVSALVVTFGRSERK